jgi:hypothetical protein
MPSAFVFAYRVVTFCFPISMGAIGVALMGLGGAVAVEDAITSRTTVPLGPVLTGAGIVAPLLIWVGRRLQEYITEQKRTQAERKKTDETIMELRERIAVLEGQKAEEWKPGMPPIYRDKK